MEATFTYRERDFTIRVTRHQPLDYTAAITELGRHMSQPGYSYRESFEWDSDETRYGSAKEAMLGSIAVIIDTYDLED